MRRSVPGACGAPLHCMSRKSVIAPVTATAATELKPDRATARRKPYIVPCVTVFPSCVN
jgi:hypothetical protein